MRVLRVAEDVPDEGVGVPAQLRQVPRQLLVAPHQLGRAHRHVQQARARQDVGGAGEPGAALGVLL